MARLRPILPLILVRQSVELAEVVAIESALCQLLHRFRTGRGVKVVAVDVPEAWTVTPAATHKQALPRCRFLAMARLTRVSRLRTDRLAL
eukprot:2130099-Amphidinium_carterae.1